MTLQIHAEAEAELREAVLYYVGCRRSLGQIFHDRVADVLQDIRKSPLRFPIYEGRRLRLKYRRARVEGFLTSSFFGSLVK